VLPPKEYKDCQVLSASYDDITRCMLIRQKTGTGSHQLMLSKLQNDHHDFYLQLLQNNDIAYAEKVGTHKKAVDRILEHRRKLCKKRAKVLYEQ
jgi:ActR/RegA family two-component response regulator